MPPSPRVPDGVTANCPSSSRSNKTASAGSPVVAGGKLHDDAVGLHAALPDALPEAVAVCAERLAAVGVVSQQRFGRFEDGRQRFGLPSAPAAKIPVTAAPALERRTSRPPAQRSV